MTHLKHKLLSSVSVLDTKPVQPGGFRLPAILHDGKFHQVQIEQLDGAATIYIDGKVHREPWFPHNPDFATRQRANVRRLTRYLDRVLTPCLEDYLFARYV